MLDAAAGQGARTLVRWPVERIEKAGNGFRLTATDGRCIDAERVIVAAGGWLPHLVDRLPLPSAFRNAPPPLQVQQENTYHFPYRDPSVEWPTFIHHTPTILTYGLPGGSDAGFLGQKVAEFNGGKPILSAAAQDGRIDHANQAE